jgi:uncharacterized protein YegP (UPF0339 family)
MKRAAFVRALGLCCAISLLSPTAGAKISPPETEKRFEVFEGKDHKAYFRMRARNGEIILQSRAYKDRKDARHAVDAVKGAACDPKHFEVRKSKNAQYYFALKGDDDKFLGRSEMYKSQGSARKGIASVQKNAGCK